MYRSFFSLQLSDKASVMDRWILSRLSEAVQECNQGFRDYDFPMATTALYNFWVYELCDVYFEALKPVVYTGEDEQAKLISRNVLYTCLDTALRLISPLMPYISEELFQRLPRRQGETIPSVSVAPYPEQLPFRDEALDRRLKLMQEVVRTIRSMRQDFLPPKARPEVYVVCKTTESEGILKEFVDATTTLSQCSKVHILTTETVPGGCTMTTVGASCEVHLMLRGMVPDVDQEIARLETKMGKLDTQIHTVTQKMEMENYEEKVPVEVRGANRDRVQALETEKENLQRALHGFKTLS